MNANAIEWFKNNNGEQKLVEPKGTLYKLCLTHVS